MYGAILGDIIGSRFEFDRGGKTKDFELLTIEDKYTDDSVMTVAITEALLNAGIDASVDQIEATCIESMKKWGEWYPNAGYGQRFWMWLFSKGKVEPYGSYGNGSAMRVSAAGWLYDSVERTREVARATANVTHNHPEGLKGAECTAAVIYLARTGASKDAIAEYVEREFAYDYSETLDEMRARHRHGKVWSVAFTSHAEYEKGEPSRVLSNFIDTSMKFCMESQTDGFIINPWSQSFLLTKELMEMIFKADGSVEYTVPDDEITAELLEDGSYLKRAIEICNRNRTQLNLIKLAKILRDSWVWVPCNAIFSDADNEAVNKVVMAAIENNDLDSLVGHTFKSQDEVRMVPDILQNGDEYFFPVFTSEEAMGEYGEQFSKVQRHFLEAANLARNNEKQVKGIVINAFTEPFEIPVELFDIIAGMKSSVEEEESDE